MACDLVPADPLSLTGAGLEIVCTSVGLVGLLEAIRA